MDRVHDGHWDLEGVDGEIHMLCGFDGEGRKGHSLYLRQIGNVVLSVENNVIIKLLKIIVTDYVQSSAINKSSNPTACKP